MVKNNSRSASSNYCLQVEEEDIVIWRTTIVYDRSPTVELDERLMREHCETVEIRKPTYRL